MHKDGAGLRVRASIFARVEGRSRGRTGTWKRLLAFAAIYLIWGSTFLAIRYAVETLPPLLMAGSRSLVAGLVLYGWSKLRHPEPLRSEHVQSALVIGALLFLGGHGLLAWGEERVDSALAALLLATIPLWMVLLDWLRRDGSRPTGKVIAGLALGFLGVTLVFLPGAGDWAGFDRVRGAGLLLGALSWAAGSIYSRSATVPQSPMLAAALSLLAGGILLFLAAAVTGEPAQLNWGSLSLRSLLALGYLIVFGSLIAFTAYTWLLKVSTPAKVGTYAYINPLIAMFLGWALAGEKINARILSAAAITLVGVALIARSSMLQRPPVDDRSPLPDGHHRSS